MAVYQPPGPTAPEDHASIASHTDGGDVDEPGGSGGNEGGSDSPPTKRAKINRARRACLPCRKRKCKCLGEPPNPCQNCIEDLYACHWPTNDGRSSEARKERRRGKRLLEMAESGLPPSTSNGKVFAGSVSIAGPLRPTKAYPVAPHPPPPPPLQQAPVPMMAPIAQPPNPLSGMFTDFTNPMFNFDLSTNVFDALDTGYNWPQGFDNASLVYAMSSQLPQVEEGLTEDMSPFSELNTLPGQAGTVSGVSGNASMGTMVNPLVGNTVAAVGTGTRGGPEAGGSLVAPPDKRKKMVKINWWRPHGSTAIAPGLKKVTLKVQLESTPPTRDSPSGASGRHRPSFGDGDDGEDLHGPDGMPGPRIMKHLLDVFISHFGCQFPFVDKVALERDINEGTGSVFLFNCIAATAARFSDHPQIKLPSLQPHEYGEPFHKIAKDMMGSMLSVPSRETIMALVLLAHVGFAMDSESEEWMCTGMAVRMAVDLALHLDPEPDSISPEERRLNRLLFWSVYFLDIAISFGVGRESTFRIKAITQTLPTESDLFPLGKPADIPPSPLPYTARQMLAYGTLVNILNGPKRSETEWDSEIHSVVSKAVKEYNELPAEMQWSVPNFQLQSKAKQGAIFLHLHLWMHHIIASRYLIGTEHPRLRPDLGKPTDLSSFVGVRSGAMTPAAIADWNLWRNSARTIGDILVISDILDPQAYLAQPFVNQAFFVAGCCYVRELELEQRRRHKGPDRVKSSSPVLKRSASAGNGGVNNLLNAAGGSGDGGVVQSSGVGTAAATSGHAGGTGGGESADGMQKAELFRALFKSVASNNISTFQQGLSKQTVYWSGAAWVAEALKQRLSGTEASKIDLVAVTEKLASNVTIPDAGVIGQARVKGQGKGSVHTDAQVGFANVGGLNSGSGVTVPGMPLGGMGNGALSGMGDGSVPSGHGVAMGTFEDVDVNLADFDLFGSLGFAFSPYASNNANGDAFPMSS